MQNDDKQPTVASPIKPVVSCELEADTWYWMSVYSEGDIFYPVYSVDGKNLKVDGFDELVGNLSGATFDKAVMPNSN